MMMLIACERAVGFHDLLAEKQDTQRKNPSCVQRSWHSQRSLHSERGGRRSSSGRTPCPCAMHGRVSEGEEHRPGAARRPRLDTLSSGLRTRRAGIVMVVAAHGTRLTPPRGQATSTYKFTCPSGTPQRAPADSRGHPVGLRDEERPTSKYRLNTASLLDGAKPRCQSGPMFENQEKLPRLPLPSFRGKANFDSRF